MGKINNIKFNRAIAIAEAKSFDMKAFNLSDPSKLIAWVPMQCLKFNKYIFDCIRKLKKTFAFYLSQLRL